VDWSGRHQLKTGADVNRNRFTQFVDRHGYEIRREDKSLVRAVSFEGPNEFGRKNFESALYLQDNWTPRDGLVVEAGVRADWDQVIRDPLLSPRLAVAYVPRWWRSTKLSAGWGVFHDALSLRTLSQHLDQRSISQFFGRDGLPIGSPVETFFLVDE